MRAIALLLCYVLTSVIATSAEQAALGMRVECQLESCTSCDSSELVVNRATVMVHYTASIDADSVTGMPGKVFDSSRSPEEIDGGRNQPQTFLAGLEHVTKGLDLGVIGLCKGARAAVIVPPELAYGDEGKEEAGIPGGATVRFDVEVLDVRETDLFSAIDLDRDDRFDREELREYFKSQNFTEQDVDPMWVRLDADNDTYISWGEFDGPKGTMPPSERVASVQLKDEV